MLAFVITLQGLDLATTLWALRHPRNREANPLVAALMRAIGRWPALVVVKAAGVVAALALAGQNGGAAVLAAIAAVYVIVIARNIRAALRR